MPARKPTRSSRTSSKSSPKRPTKSSKTARAPKAPPPGSKRAASKKPARKHAATVPAAAKPVADEKVRQKAMLVAQAGLSKKAEEVVILDVRGLSSVADFFVIMSGNGPRQVNAVAEAVEEELGKLGHKTIGSEGRSVGQWVLLDYGDVVAHVFEPEVRAHYDLEGNWADAPRERVGTPAP